jgi:hypothetical protein
LSDEEMTVRDVAKLIKSTGATTQEDRDYLASYIGGFDNYSTAGAQY